MSIVAGTRRKDTCSNVIGGLKSITMNPPTPLQYGKTYNQTGSSKAAKYAAWGGSGADATSI